MSNDNGIFDGDLFKEVSITLTRPNFGDNDYAEWRVRVWVGSEFLETTYRFETKHHSTIGEIALDKCVEMMKQKLGWRNNDKTK